MRLFNDMVTSILHCDKPVICRVNGMRIAGGQEIGMACDFTLAQDLALFGQAGPRHGSAPDGGSTDFLPLFIGIEAAMESCTLCEHWTAHKAYRMGLLTKVVPALKVDGTFVPNPMAITDRWIDEMGQIVYGEMVKGEAKAKGKEMLKSGQGRGLSHHVSGHDHARVPGEDHRERPQAQAGPLGQEPGDEPGVAGAQHDDGGQSRIQSLQRGVQGVPGARLHPPQAADGGGRQVG
jgi:enoyl-CoA hydratase/carnithine racemase